MKKKFNLSEYPGKVVMHCPEKQQAERFCKFLHDAGRRWNDGDAYPSHTAWDTYGSEMVYYFNKGEYGRKFVARNNDVQILEYSDFEWDNAGATDNNVATKPLELTESLVNAEFTKIIDTLPCAETPVGSAEDLLQIIDCWASSLYLVYRLKDVTPVKNSFYHEQED